MPIRTRRGEVIQRMALKVNDSQIVLREPKAIELLLFRNDDKGEFRIYLCMPDNSIHTLESDTDEDKARRRYSYLAKQLREGRAKIEVGCRISIIEE